MRLSYSIYFLLVFCVSATLLSSCSSKRKKEALAQQKAGPKPVPKVDGYIVQTKAVSESIEVPGTIVAQEATEIHPEVSGRITGLYIREGAYVNKGALLAKLYDADLQDQRRKLQVQLKIAQQAENRSQQLISIGGISKQDYESSTLQVSNIRADLDITNTEIAKTEVRAPFSGKLGLKQISVGAYVTPQSVLTSIQKTAGLRIDFSVPEKYAPQIETGDYVNFTTTGTSRKYTAVVMATESGVQENTRNLIIRAQVKGDQTDLIPGGFAKVQLNFDPDPNALMVPSQAIIPQARGKKVVVYKNGIAKFNDVVTGIRDSANVQIVSGLQKGDTVVITGLLGVKPDTKINVRKITNP